jgi:hypothetical protein
LESLLPQLGAVSALIANETQNLPEVTEPGKLCRYTADRASFEESRLCVLATALNMAHDSSNKAFLSSARLYAVVPETSNSRFSEVLVSANQDDEADGALPLPIKERKVLFFGELALSY